MSQTIAFDLTRLFLGPLFLAPRGIDRVDLALAQHVFADPESANLAILPTPWGMRAYPAAIARLLIDHVQQLWAERSPDGHDHQSDPRVRRLIDGICARPVPDEPIPAQTLSLAAKVRRIVQELCATGLHFGRPADSAVPKGATYLNVGQLGLAVPLFFNWIERRPDLVCAMMLHDVIPLEYPHLVRPGHAGHHARMVRTAARHADCLIFTSAHARDTVCRALARHGRMGVPNLVRPLPLPEAFAKVGDSFPSLADKSYFLVVSTIEPRKNHAMLLRVWKRLVERLGVHAPHLVLVGSRGFDAERILAPLGRDANLRGHVHEACGLPSPALASLTLGATGLLSPSLAEGFGLPVLEANALGVPTIASDIAAHREVANGATTLLACDDEDAWETAIAGLSPISGRCRPQMPEAMTEESYCRDLLDFLVRTAHDTHGGARPCR